MISIPSLSWSRAVGTQRGRLLVAVGLGSCVCQRTGDRGVTGGRIRQSWVDRMPSIDGSAEV